MIKMNKKQMLKRWEDTLREKEIEAQIYKDIKSALDFSNHSTLVDTDLCVFFSAIHDLSKESNSIKIDDLVKKTKYSRNECNSLIMRLKKLGEIYHPFLGKEKEGVYIKII
jgi:hypothetical protein